MLRTKVLAIAILIFVVLLGGISFIYYSKVFLPRVSATVFTADWKTYQDIVYGLAFKYPKDLVESDTSLTFHTSNYQSTSKYLGGDWPTEIISKGATLNFYADPESDPNAMDKATKLYLQEGHKITTLSIEGQPALLTEIEDQSVYFAQIFLYRQPYKKLRLRYNFVLKSRPVDKIQYRNLLIQVASTFKTIPSDIKTAINDCYNKDGHPNDTESGCIEYFVSMADDVGLCHLVTSPKNFCLNK